MNLLARQLGEQQVAGFFLVLARISPLFVLAPLFSSQLLPPRVRGIVAVALAVGLMPVVVHDRIPMETFELAGLIGKELLVGMAFAFSLGALFAALSVAGTFLDTSIGFSFGSIVDPITGSSAAVLAQLYALIGVLIFIAIGGDAWVIQGLARTYDLVPLTEAPALGSLVEGTTVAFTGVLVAAVQVSAPVLLAVVITDAGIGVVSKVMPSLNVFSVSFPAKVAVGLLLIGASLPFAAGWLHDELQASVAAALDTLEVSG
jgi:flagellar biosynthetic protein FliR